MSFNTARLGFSLVSASLTALSVLFYQACAVPSSPNGHYEIKGKHRALTCSSCHAPGDAFKTDARNCVACHYQNMPTPHHPGECGECHVPTGWRDLQVAHSFFPLDLGHGGVNCNDCHAANTYYGLDPSCTSCHEGIRPENHPPGGCENCHTIAEWPLLFHTHSSMDMSGMHEPLACDSCHVNNPDFTGLDATCESCHAGQRPSAHFEGTCASCHNASSWTDANFDHSSYFPVPHRNASRCGQCHVADSYSLFSCTTGCHAKSSTDGQHWGENVGGYSYTPSDSSNCLACHPSGR